MDIKDILSGLGLDFSNPEVKRGATEAIEAILASRAPMAGGAEGGGSGNNDTTEIELDPDLIQPSIKKAPSGLDNEDIEIDDEENILDQIKHKEAEEPIENTNSGGQDSTTNDESSSSDESNTDYDDSTESTLDDVDADEDPVDTDELDDSAMDDVDSSETGDATETGEDQESSESEEDDAAADNTSIEDTADDELEGEAGQEQDTEEDEVEEADSDSEIDDEEFEFDEDELVDDELKDSTEDKEIKTKREARKIKRERTLAAAKKALSDAQAKRVSPALLKELENAIKALEALTEAVTKNLNDISDAEFNQIINRVFDAIQACGDSGLTFTSEDEREAQVKNIKDDLADASTQAELSAEDVAKIRAETQAIKAREKETAQYKRKSAGSFKGFQEFLNSLYRAVALQVHTEEEQDDSWSAISRRNSGAGVLRQGKKINELSNRKIPVIDFYFDQSGSWTASDIQIGEKAVQSLAEMEADGKIKINIYYFADSVHTEADSARNEGGTGAWNEIVKNIIATQATNVVIMTDDDMEGWWRPQRQPALKYTVPGYVWYLWKNGDNAPRLPRDLKGRGGVQQFAFSANDI